VRGWDPVAAPVARELLRGVDLCDSLEEAVAGADAAVVVTEWDELRRLTSIRDSMRKPLVVDGRNFFDPDELRAAGFIYDAIGRASVSLPGLTETDLEPELRP
jgi:UDPglucose 6-dehydrogenase